MDSLSEFARQGLGYLIATLEAGVIAWLFKRIDDKEKLVQAERDKNDALQEKRVVESTKYTEGFIGIGKDLINGMTGIKEAQQSFTRFIEKITLKQ